MPKAYKNATGWYIPMDGPWQSEEDKAALKLAEEKYAEEIKANPYVALIRSHQDYTHGYWIETVQNKVAYPDLILKFHKQ